MKNLKILVAFVGLTLLTITGAKAEFGIGASLHYMNVEASGNEKPSVNPNSARDTESASVDNDVIIGSLFAEYAFEDLYNLVLGYEYVPGSADVSDGVKQRTDRETSVTDTVTETTTDRVFKAQAEVENFQTIYAEIGSSYFVRLGYAEIDVNTKEEKSGNGGSYGNATLDGINYGIGYKSGPWKVSYEVTDFDSLSLVSTGNSTDSGTNTLSADLDTTALKLSYGFKF